MSRSEAVYFYFMLVFALGFASLLINVIANKTVLPNQILPEAAGEHMQACSR